MNNITTFFILIAILMSYISIRINKNTDDIQTDRLVRNSESINSMCNGK